MNEPRAECACAGRGVLLSRKYKYKLRAGRDPFRRKNVVESTCPLRKLTWFIGAAAKFEIKTKSAGASAYADCYPVSVRMMSKNMLLLISVRIKSKNVYFLFLNRVESKNCFLSETPASIFLNGDLSKTW
ncbi:hypothetical protein PYW08_012916 [Mythimna loreyi]|uniref:Uncharacterized protein n=1 Tax=Mythimna loreyi TaxID=667449 RepID=A0ACC2Q1T7_9NEOP|nr:hypothetical protein PYW08_012916 [Mythimna loreyi]